MKVVRSSLVSYVGSESDVQHNESFKTTPDVKRKEILYMQPMMSVVNR